MAELYLYFFSFPVNQDPEGFGRGEKERGKKGASLRPYDYSSISLFSVFNALA